MPISGKTFPHEIRRLTLHRRFSANAKLSPSASVTWSGRAHLDRPIGDGARIGYRFPAKPQRRFHLKSMALPAALHET
jgi:hypothetical protein